MRKILTATTMILGLVAASCASDGSASGAGGYGGGGSAVASGAVSATATGAASASATGGGGRYGYGSGGGSGSGGGGGGPVTGSVVAANYAFTPSNVTVESGATIEVQNSTPQTPHTFTVPGKDLDVALDPQSTSEVTIHLPPGTYSFECRYHAGSGMKGTLIVT
jgi:plastocyanin